MFDRCCLGPAASPVRARLWRDWVIIVLLAGISTASISFVWHAGHDADRECAVCKLRTQPFAEPTTHDLVARADCPEAVNGPLAACSPTRPVSTVPPRAPPLT